MKVLKKIIGIFWAKDVPEGVGKHVFEGVIYFNEEGQFYGELSDHFGKSKIDGMIISDNLTFRKSYHLEGKSGAAFFPIAYMLKKSEEGGWYGNYYYDNREKTEPDFGYAVCVIY